MRTTLEIDDDVISAARELARLPAKALDARGPAELMGIDQPKFHCCSLRQGEYLRTLL